MNLFSKKLQQEVIEERNKNKYLFSKDDVCGERINIIITQTIHPKNTNIKVQNVSWHILWWFYQMHDISQSF